MYTKDDRWLNQSGLNLIRIVIGSYFAAVGLDLVAGVDQRALFLPFTPPEVADVVGSTLLILASLTFMLGVCLRLSALVLALFVFSSSVAQNFLLVDVENVSDFWRDLTMVCAVILTYSNMTRLDIRRANLTRAARRKPVRKIHMPGAAITPRRVQPPKLVTPAEPRASRLVLELPTFMQRPTERRRDENKIDINLFAEI